MSESNNIIKSVVEILEQPKYPFVIAVASITFLYIPLPQSLQLEDLNKYRDVIKIIFIIASTVVLVEIVIRLYTKFGKLQKKAASLQEAKKQIEQKLALLDEQEAGYLYQFLYHNKNMLELPEFAEPIKRLQLLGYITEKIAPGFKTYFMINDDLWELLQEDRFKKILISRLPSGN